MANGSPNLDFAMRLSADLGDAAQEVAQLDAALDKIEAAGANAAKGLSSTATASNAAATANAKNTTAANANAAAMGKQAGAANNAARATKNAAISQAQYNMAMRQLPMQVTDIVTGLSSGQSPFMVLIQQGGQLKDSFGGVVPAARALLGAISPLAIAGGAVAAVLGTIAVGAIKGYQEIQNLERALISTGGIAGQTAGQIADMADRVGEATGEFGDADKAALQLAQSGKLSGETLEAAMGAAVNLSKLTGESIEETSDKIVKLAESPSAMLLKLNEQYHFLTAEVYDHVKSLEEQGKAEDAARLAVEAFADVHEKRVREAEERAGWLEKAWVGLGNTIAGVWDSIKSIGRDDAEAQLAAAQRQLANLQNPAMWAHGMAPSDQQVKQAEALVKAAQDRVAAGQRAATQEKAARDAEEAKLKARQEAEKASQEWERLRNSNLSKQQKLEAEIASIRKLGITAGKSEAEIEAQIAQARARYQESLPKAPKGQKSDAQREEEAAQRELGNLTKQTTLLGQVEDGEKRVSEEARIRYEIEHGAYQAATDATKQQLITQAQALDNARKQREEQEKQKKELEDTERAYERLHDRLRAPVDAATDSVTDQIETLNKALAKGIIDAKQYGIEIARIGAKALTTVPGFDLTKFGIGDPDADHMAEASKTLQDWFTEQLAIINAGRAAGKQSNDYWDKQEADARAQHYAALNQLAIAQNQLQLMQASAIFGSMAEITKSFAGEQSKTYQALFAISKGFAVAQLATSLAINVAKASEQGFPQNLGLIAAAMAQGAQIAAILSGANFSAGGAAGYATGGRITGAGTGTSDSIPIWASHGEFMTRAAIVRQPGALQFLEDFNSRGMAALRDRRGYAVGGLITPEPIYSPSEPRSNISDSSAMQTSVNNKMRVYLLQNEDQLAQRLAQHPAMEKAVVAIAGQNGTAIRTEW